MIEIAMRAKKVETVIMNIVFWFMDLKSTQSEVIRATRCSGSASHHNPR